jgi:hypothetical protein
MGTHDVGLFLHLLGVLALASAAAMLGVLSLMVAKP